MCAALRRADPDIVEIVQFGSSVYAPALALDVDLIVTRKARKDDDRYFDAVDQAGCPLRVDVVTLEAGEKLHALAASVWPAHRVLYGSGVWRNLPAAHAQEFRQFIRTVHIQYFYEGRSPRETVQREFDAWRSRAERFIRGLSGPAPDAP